MSGRRRDWAVLALIVAGFLVAASRQLALPALAYDEATDATMGMELVAGLPRTPSDWAVTIGGSAWPLRLPHPYDFSAFKIYWAALAFHLAGVSVAALRWSALALAAALLVLLYMLARPYLSRPAALSAPALLAAHPSFLIWSRTGYLVVEVFLSAFALAAIVLASAWHRGRAPWALYAACFVLGFSTNLATKSLAFVLALPAVYWLWAPRESLPSARQAAAAAGWLALGASNALLFALLRGGIVPQLLSALASRTAAGVDNLSFFANAATRLSQVSDVLSGVCAADSAGPVLAAASLTPALGLGSVALLAAAAVGAQDAAARRRAGALVTLLALLFVQTCFTPMGLLCFHELLLLPFLALAAAAALDLAWRAAGTTAARAAVAAAVLAALGLQCRADAAYFAQLRATGGVGLVSDALYEAGDYLAERGIAAPYALTWGLASNLYLASAGRVAPVDLHSFRSAPGAPTRARFARAAAEPEARFLGVADGVPDQARRTGSREAFETAVAQAGRELVVERAFTGTGGRPVLLLYRTRPKR